MTSAKAKKSLYTIQIVNNMTKEVHLVQTETLRIENRADIQRYESLNFGPTYQHLGNTVILTMYNADFLSIVPKKKRKKSKKKPRKKKK